MHRIEIWGILGLIVLGGIIWSIVRSHARQGEILAALEEQKKHTGDMVRTLERIAILLEHRPK